MDVLALFGACCMDKLQFKKEYLLVEHGHIRLWPESVQFQSNESWPYAIANLHFLVPKRSSVLKTKLYIKHLSIFHTNDNLMPLQIPLASGEM